ncbi:MAG TPA: hypothetical protein VGW75_14065 [Solirubrobacteraceae bacterium]|jgi:hypothetical protein|nr:hypothetical protein [Solirubrobacteraceae bacterium]
MRSAISAAAACAALLAAGAAPAAADIVNETVSRCEADVTWQLSGDPFGGVYADFSYDTGTASGTGCKHLSVVVQDDGDPAVVQGDHGAAGSVRFALFGVWATGDFAFAGTAERLDGQSRGPLTIANGLLDATTVLTEPDGTTAVVVHRGTGTCGARCFRTRSAWAVTE